MRFFLVSNLYPSKKNPNFGTFVAAFCDAVVEQDCEIPYKVVKDRIYSNKLLTFLSYILFYFRIVYVGIVGKYDIVYVHYIAHSSIPVLILSYLKPSKVILNVHGDDILPRTRLVSFFQIFIRKLLKKVNLVVVPSLFFKNIFCEKYNYSASKVWVYPSGGVDLDVFKRIDLAKKDIGFQETDFVVGFVSRIVEGKGWRLFVDAVKKMNSVFPNVKGLIVGNGPEVEQLLMEIHKNNLDNVLTYREGVGHTNLSLFYSSMDVMVFPSYLQESLGLVGLEAMACGVPVIGTNTGGISSYIDDGVNGYLFTLGQLNDLVEKISIIYNSDIDSRNAMTHNCLLTSLQYDSKMVTQKLVLKLSML